LSKHVSEMSIADCGRQEHVAESMRLRFLVTCIVAVLVVPLVGQEPSLDVRQEPSARFLASTTELVVLPVVVIDDRRGGYITDLARDRFAVYDNGRRQTVALFTNEDSPVTIGLVIDNSGSMSRKMPEVIVGTTAFARSSNPEDEVFVLSFNDTVVEPHGGEPLTAGALSGLEARLRSMVPQGQTALYDALMAALDRVERSAQSRKALIVISDGGDNASRTTLEAVLARARRSNVTIFTLGLFDNDDPDRNPQVLKALAESTGGARFLPRSPSVLLQACTQIARELRSGYTIGFVPPDRDGAFHRIRVEVAPERSGKMSVRTRPGYFAATAAVTRQ
jgi:Ca-activated chloride channel family protein